jgi:hypothetical protein
MIAAAPGRTIAEGPPYRQPPGGHATAATGSDRECGRRKLPKHHHHPMIAADGKDSVEARPEPASAFGSLPPPVKQSNRCKSRSTVRPRPTQKQRPAGVEIDGNIGGQPIRRRRFVVSSPPIPPAVHGYHYAGAKRRPARRGRTCGPNPDRSPATGSATASREPNANKRSRTQRKSLNFQGSSGMGPRSGRGGRRFKSCHSDQLSRCFGTLRAPIWGTK